jgi:hypothetical protein
MFLKKEQRTLLLLLLLLLLYLLPILPANASAYKTGNVLKLNIKARSHNRCCGGTAICIKYSKYVFVALLIQYAMRMRHIFLSV